VITSSLLLTPIWIVLYHSIFVKGEYGSNYISFATSLLGDIPFGSWNTYLYACKISWTTSTSYGMDEGDHSSINQAYLLGPLQ
jgi:hypothetical protein